MVAAFVVYVAAICWGIYRALLLLQRIATATVTVTPQSRVSSQCLSEPESSLRS